MKLIQVAYDIKAEKTRRRELSALFAAGKKFKCDDLVLVTDRVNETVKEGCQTVRIVDVVTWLLETDREKIRDDLFAKGRGAAEEAKRIIAERPNAHAPAVGEVGTGARTRDDRRETRRDMRR